MKNFLLMQVSKVVSAVAISATLVTTSAFEYLDYQIDMMDRYMASDKTDNKKSVQPEIIFETTKEETPTVAFVAGSEAETVAETYFAEETEAEIAESEITSEDDQSAYRDEAEDEAMEASFEEELIQIAEENQIPETTKVVETTVAQTEAPVVETKAPVKETKKSEKVETVESTETAPEIETVSYNPAVVLTGINDLTYASQSQQDLFKSVILTKINELRVSCGLAPLSSSMSLAGCADLRAKEVVSKFSHTRPDGTRGFYVVASCKGEYEYAVNCLLTGASNSYWLGENLAYQYGWSDYSGTDEEIIALACEIFESWRNSPTHYENMVNPNFTMVGVGLDVSLEAGFYRYTSVLLFSNLY